MSGTIQHLSDEIHPEGYHGSRILLLGKPERQHRDITLRFVEYQRWKLPTRPLKRTAIQFNFFLVKKGTGIIQLDDQSYRLTPGALVRNSPPTRVHITPDRPGMEILRIILSGKNKGQAVAGQLRYCPPLMPRPALCDVTQIMDTIWNVMKRKTPCVEEMGDRLAEAFLWALRDAVIDSRDSRPQSPAELKFEEIRAFFEDNLNHIAGPEDAARACNVSRSYMVKLFHRYAGASPARWWRTRQMEHAMACLMEQGFTVKQTAARLGYADEFGFSKAFKRIVGQSPDEFRRS